MTTDAAERAMVESEALVEGLNFTAGMGVRVRGFIVMACVAIVRLTAIVIFLDKSVLMTSLSEATFVAVLLLLLKILRT